MLGIVLGTGPMVSAQNVTQPDAAGIFPSLVHQGDIVEFLKLMSAATKKNIIPSRAVRGPVTVNLFDVTFEEALDAVLSSNGYASEEKGAFIFVYTQKEYADLTASAKRMETQLFQLNYIPARDVEELIKPLLSGSAKVTTSPEAGTASSETGEQWAANNYIIVLDYPEQLEQVAELIAKVDTRPAQVLIEATILVADVSDTNKLGVDFNILGGLDFLSAEIGDFEITEESLPLSGTASVVQSGSSGLKVGIFKNNMEILIDALETITDVVTIGNPKILTLNRQQGKVLVGNRDGYITTEVSQTTATQTVEFLETGTSLIFRPFVMDDGYIRMELDTEDSDGGVETKDGFTLPSETTANVTSNVLVKDGRTIIIGGLFRDKTSFTRSQVPLLGNFPVIGPIFRSTTDTVSKEEVIFMITPHIVEESTDYAEAEAAMENINTLRLGIREGLMFQGRTSLASANYQTAREKEAAGKLNDALWHATMATQCNPAFLDAIRLREDLLNRQLYAEEYGSMQNMMRNILASQCAASAADLEWAEGELAVSQADETNEVIVDISTDANAETSEPVEMGWVSAAVPVVEETPVATEADTSDAGDAWDGQESASDASASDWSWIGQENSEADSNVEADETVASDTDVAEVDENEPGEDD